MANGSEVSFQKMNVLYVITRADRGGAQVHLLDLISGASKYSNSELACGEEGYLTEAASKMGIPFHVLPNLVRPINPVRDFQATVDLVNLIRNRRPDLIHAHTSKAGVLARLAARISGVPSIFTSHTWCFAEGTSWKWKLIGTPMEFVAARLGTAIINVSAANAELAVSHRIAPRKSMVTIHNGVPTAANFDGRPNAEPPIIVMVARFVAQKDHALLMEALTELELPFKLLLVGDGPTRPAAERLVAELGLSSRVAFLGDRPDVHQILDRASVFVLTTHWEGFPLSILEAMQHGLPIIATDVGGVREAVQDYVNGYLVPHSHRWALVDSLHELLKSPQLRQKMGAESRRIYYERFTLDTMVNRTVGLYEDVLVASGRPPAFSKRQSA